MLLGGSPSAEQVAAAGWLSVYRRITCTQGEPATAVYGRELGLLGHEASNVQQMFHDAGGCCYTYQAYSVLYFDIEVKVSI